MMRKGDDRFRAVHEDEPLFITGRRTGRVIAYRVFSASVFFCICWIWLYRVTAPVEVDENRTGLVRFVWLVMLVTEIWFGLYWIVMQSPRWNPVWRFTFTDRLSRRYGDDLPRLDVFVCTADPVIEPPLMVVNTVLSVAALDYPPEKLAVYLSDDGGSELTFYALAEAAEFAKVWVPYCKRFNVEPRSPAAYLTCKASGFDSAETEEVARLYKEMAARIETAARLGIIPDEARLKYGDGFSQWDSHATRRNHGTILQILVDGRKGNTVTVPTLVYLSREKRPEHHHHFKAGSMNALIRVSSKITCGRIILNLDCDMYSNNSKSARDALCILLDEKEGKKIAFVQFPQCFENLTKNDLYASMMRVGYDVEFNGLDGNGGPLYIGTGCFHRRDVICGRKYGEVEVEEEEESEYISETEMIKALASCTYEENSQWGKEMGVKYGCPAEDVITGLGIKCRGWKSAYLNPKKKAFVGVAPTNLHQMLVQQRRWSEGNFQVLLSVYSPVWYGQGKIGLGLILGYCCYCLWAPSSVPVLIYSVLTSLCLLKGIPLFPKVWSSWWFIPFGYVTVAANAYSLVEFLWCGGTLRGWWNEQRTWLYRRTSSFIEDASDRDS
ncbi:cellulose synthase-like protein E1 isoform X3 [Brassica rapa]|uniref:cellulose synthase-like protein E1 n=1 Tax=Brassica napus TaxID=3708 RepID=UPI000872803D|nr:cellulose synthase-like protein E1 isoform X1 [Brassica rapa]XP_033133650.1 cellulose synthase-like protein E1 isoform X2 [Brassica rapa]XP_033133651.1 cellulose synthase-like protein E1 isoform X3 [Brassica rapa]XP_048593334.1 cellulose synthase-like protein E1 [Brassica napus]